MGLEAGDGFISGLVVTNPVGATDPKSQGDDHLRLLKVALKGTFPNLNAAVTASPTELNYIDGVTGVEGTGKIVLALTATLPALSGVNLTALNASNLASGTVPDARFPSTLPALNGSALTNLNATNLSSGTVADGRLSSNVPLKNAANIFTANQSIQPASGVASIEIGSTTSGDALALLDTFGVQNWAVGNRRSDGALVFSAAATLATPRLEISAAGAFNFKGGEVTTDHASASEVGYQGIPINLQTADYQVVAADNGKTIYASTACDQVTNIASSASFLGFTYTVIANGGAPCVLVQGTGNTFFLAGTAFGTTGNRTIAVGGEAVLKKFDQANGYWLVSGVGVS